MTPAQTSGPWKRVHLSTVADVRLGRQRSPKNHTGPNMIPYIRAANVTWDGLDLSDVKTMNFTPEEAEIYRLRPGDVLLGEASGSPDEVGKPAIWRNDLDGCCFQNTLLRVRPDTKVISSEFLRYLFLYEALTGGFAAASRGVGIHHLGAAAMVAWSVPLPSRLEQDRIVDAIDEELSRLDAAVAGLRSVQRKLLRLKESTITMGVTGSLLAQDETDRIEPIHARPQREGRDANGDDAIGPLLTGMPSVPSSWTWVTLAAIAEIVGGITKDAKRETGEDLVEVPYLRVANVQRGWLDLTDVSTIRASRERIRELALRAGDILFNEGGDRDKLGRGWVWNGAIQPCIHQNHVFRARLNDSGIQPKFISWFGNTVAARWFERAGKQTTNLASISRSSLKRLPIPLPPHAEQMRIVQELERRLSIIERTMHTVDLETTRVAVLKRAILASAFRGTMLDDHEIKDMTGPTPSADDDRSHLNEGAPA